MEIGRVAAVVTFPFTGIYFLFLSSFFLSLFLLCTYLYDENTPISRLDDWYLFRSTSSVERKYVFRPRKLGFSLGTRVEETNRI